MASNADPQHGRHDARRPGPTVPEGVERTGTYEADDGIVFYDSEDPLAWLRASGTVRLADYR